ncbi:MAG TPA: hypothetical protein VLR29_06815, partial [Flavobacterium sp.]|nr:hypothetical protein [Flavobacterium sp.]
MRKTVIFFALLVTLITCNKKSETEKAVETVPMDIKVVRFDKIFFETSPKDLYKVKKEFPFFFPKGTDD